MSSRKPRITKAPEVRREELLAAGFRLFQEVGYESTSVQMITDAVGISKGLFYHYFDSKATLLAAEAAVV
jgi:AcrR family transcriptional regulator